MAHGRDCVPPSETLGNPNCQSRGTAIFRVIHPRHLSWTVKEELGNLAVSFLTEQSSLVP